MWIFLKNEIHLFDFSVLCMENSCGQCEECIVIERCRDDGIPCTECIPSAFREGKTCDDGDLYTFKDICKEGKCRGDSNPCECKFFIH